MCRYTKLSIAIGLTLIISTTITAFAEDIPVEDDITRYTPLVLNQEATSINVTVPSVLPVNIDKNGNVVETVDARIINNSKGPIKIVEGSVSGVNGWEIVDDNVSTRIGKKEVKLRTWLDSYNLNPENSSNIRYHVSVSPQKEEVVDEVIFKVVYKVDWDEVVTYD